MVRSSKDGGGVTCPTISSRGFSTRRSDPWRDGVRAARRQLDGTVTEFPKGKGNRREPPKSQPQWPMAE